MEENIKETVEKKDILKHYFASLLVYGLIIICMIICPVYYEQIEDNPINYITFFVLYYLGYVLVAPIIYFNFKPKSLLNSKNIIILKYFAKQFKRNNTTKEFLVNIEPKEEEKQALMELFVKVFFGVNSVHFLLNTYLPSFGYNLDFIKAITINIAEYIKTQNALFPNIIQFIIDTGDVWIKIILTLTTLVLAFSYLTDTTIFKNKIKSVDTTPLGVLSCIICYYPLTILTSKFIVLSLNELIPVKNITLLAILNILIIAVNLMGLIATLRLFGKVGNLTNRGIVTKFPYNIIRHPIYTMQVCYIILTSIPVIILNDIPIDVKMAVIFAIFVWIGIYYLRAITEERHLINDPDYQKYVEKVKYRFIPKIW